MILPNASSAEMDENGAGRSVRWRPHSRPAATASFDGLSEVAARWPARIWVTVRTSGTDAATVVFDDITAGSAPAAAGAAGGPPPPG
ncbi:hypothetical protein ACFSL4_22545 [Streptomyces caeni]|uniref:Uncharacterized protein n=1 Tax=Streptomyces caeni TaxID=2307231 RepID=A0ABW4IU49_9ACTN